MSPTRLFLFFYVNLECDELSAVEVFRTLFRPKIKD